MKPAIPAIPANAMFGGLKVKLYGLKHVAIYYFGTPGRAPENIKLYELITNRECLHCHLGARSFEEGVYTMPTPLQCRQLSPISSPVSQVACHDMAHDLVHLKDAKFWKAGE